MADTTIQNNSFDSFVTCKFSEDLNKNKLKQIRDRENTLLSAIIRLTSSVQDKECSISKLKRELKTTRDEYATEIFLLTETEKSRENKLLVDSSKENAELVFIVAQQKEKLELQKSELKALNSRIVELQQFLRGSENKFNELMNDLEASKEENESLKKSMIQLRNDLKIALESQGTNNNSKETKSSTPVNLRIAVAPENDQFISPIQRSASECKPPSPKKRVLTRGRTINKINVESPVKPPATKPKTRMGSKNKIKQVVTVRLGSSSSTESPVKKNPSSKQSSESAVSCVANFLSNFRSRSKAIKQ